MKRDDRGFTVLEALVATFLTIVVGATVTKSLIFTTDVLGQNEVEADAVAEAQEAIEDLRTYSFDDIQGGTTTSGEFTITRDVTNDSPEDGMKAITVTVSWEWKGESRSYALHTVYAKINRT
jgi:type II secretory pathway pseudopilin PulG